MRQMFFITTEHCQKEDGYYRCYSQCSFVSDKVGLSMIGVDQLFDVSITVYQHLICPVGFYGPGCENACECSEREMCHYIRGCHIGKYVLLDRTLELTPKLTQHILFSEVSQTAHHKYILELVNDP